MYASPATMRQMSLESFWCLLSLNLMSLNLHWLVWGQQKQVRDQFSWDGELVHKQLLADVLLATRQVQSNIDSIFSCFGLYKLLKEMHGLNIDYSCFKDYLVVALLLTLWVYLRVKDAVRLNKSTSGWTQGWCVELWVRKPKQSSNRC